MRIIAIAAAFALISTAALAQNLGKQSEVIETNEKAPVAQSAPAAIPAPVAQTAPSSAAPATAPDAIPAPVAQSDNSAVMAALQKIAGKIEIMETQFKERLQKLERPANTKVVVNDPAPAAFRDEAPSVPRPAAKSQANPSAQMQRGSKEFMELAGRAYQSLGAAPGGAQIKDFTVTEPDYKGFICPNGSPAEKVSTGKVDGYELNRWRCPRSAAQIRH